MERRDTVAIIFSYNRPEMLRQQLAELYHYCDIFIVDDGSDFIISTDIPHVKSKVNGGKEGYWKQWAKAFKFIKESEYQNIIFIPDDFTKLNIDSFDAIFEAFNQYAFAFNIINDGRLQCWTQFDPIEDEVKYRVGFVDCGFLTNRATIDLLNYEMIPIPESRFKTEGISSGVGQQLSNRLMKLNVPMFLPIESMAHHGTHESKMHPRERKKHPLISK
jgi:hypothetical protein